MGVVSMKPVIEQLAARLAQSGIRSSHQRLKVLEYLLGNRNHPTSEQVYTALRRKVPSLCRSTVSNTLALFVQAHLIRIINPDQREPRYDGDMNDHGHFICQTCEAVIDFAVDIGAAPDQTLANCQIYSKCICYHGLCARCAQLTQEA